MNTFEFTIPGRLAGANEIKAANRSHWSKGAKLAKSEKEKCWIAIISEKTYGMAHLKAPVTISMRWIEPNAKRDLDNITSGQKAIIDALVTSGIIGNDTREWVQNLIHAFGPPDKENPRIEVCVYGESASRPIAKKSGSLSGAGPEAGPRVEM